MAAVPWALRCGRAEPGTAEAGRQLRSHLAGSGMPASYQRASTLDGGLVQILDDQHHYALRYRRLSADGGTSPPVPPGRDSIRACRDVNCGMEPVLDARLTT